MEGQNYKHFKTYEYPGMTVRVYRPDLTAEEHTKRMKQIYQAAEALIKEQRRVK